MSMMHVLFGFEGRIGRTVFWAGSAAAGFVYGILIAILALIGGTISPTAGIVMGCLGLVPLLWTIMALNAKRLHDRDKSGWWQGIGLFGALLAVVGASLVASGGGGAALSIPINMASLVFSLWSIWISIQMMFLPGTPGANDYGQRLPPGFGGDSAGAEAYDVPAWAENAQAKMANAARSADGIARVPRNPSAATATVPSVGRPKLVPVADRRQGFGHRNDGPERRGPQKGFGRRAPA